MAKVIKALWILGTFLKYVLFTSVEHRVESYHNHSTTGYTMLLWQPVNALNTYVFFHGDIIELKCAFFIPPLS